MSARTPTRSPRMRYRPEALEGRAVCRDDGGSAEVPRLPRLGRQQPGHVLRLLRFVSWVVNNCGVGWSIGRLTAQGYNICTPVSEAEAKPGGPPCSFEYTYEGPWITHVGIYVGDGWMIHAGDPIGYIKFMDSYYSDNFVGSDGSRRLKPERKLWTQEYLSCAPRPQGSRRA